jgi:hypothetical protein
MYYFKPLLACNLLFVILLWSCSRSEPTIRGEPKQWHTITLSFEGPEANEQSDPNPFLDYRLLVTFCHNDSCRTIRGFYAADGNASVTGAESGNKWQVRFTPDQEGPWSYSVSFRQGNQIAINDDPGEGQPVYFDGKSGRFNIGPTDKRGKDFRGKGRLQTTGGRYWRFSGSGEYFLKGGADSPENFLAYEDFDGTHYAGNKTARMGEAHPNVSLHRYAGHSKGWNTGDPSWLNGKGKGIIGALNYLASKGMNSVYFLTLNIGGDGEDVWPYTAHNERLRFDCSKLDQWEKVFTHMDSLGLMMHIVTQETENQLLLDSGYTRLERRLYYLELISRFSHHLAVTWNMGEENGYADFSPRAQNRTQQKEMIRFMKENDPYRNPVVLHTHANPLYRNEIFNDLLGFEYLDGPSVQIGDPLEAHHETLIWIDKSKQAGKTWTVNIDEIGPAWRGVDPDSASPNNQDSVRRFVLWANLMAGGGGVEWYFGYKNPHNDLNCEDLRSREKMWDYTRYALEFFQQYLPFAEMEPADNLTDNPEDYCLAASGKVYAVYLPTARPTRLELTNADGIYDIGWYNPRKGGELLKGSLTEINGGKRQSFGKPPSDPDLDWIVLIKKK